MTTEIDTTNKHLVASRGNQILFLRPLEQEMSREDALLLAAYIVALVGDDALWAQTLEAVQNT